MKKIIFLSIITILLSSYAMAEDESTDDESVEYESTESAEGESITFPDGSKYVGQFKDGKRHGQGTYTWSDGNEYEGQWKNDKFNGQGTYTKYYQKYNANIGYVVNEYVEYKYVGQWEDGKKHGQGTMIWLSDSKYVGEWKDDKRHGQGTYSYSSFKYDYRSHREDYEYVGQWKDDKMNGEGTKTWEDGSKYVGQWKDDKMNGEGTKTWEDGSKYVGQWKDDYKHGQGTSTLPDGTKYVGQFKDGKYHGKGTLYTSGGTIYQQGIFEEGKFIKASNEKPTEAPKDKLGKLIGTIGGFEGDNVVVNGKDSTIGSQAPMGQALIVDANGQYIYLESTFPMQTVVKCKVTSGDRAKIKKGMKVYLKP